MSSLYSPRDWFWLGADGRVFASARQEIVSTEDETYLAWLVAGGRPTPWPCAETGEQTDAALQEVLKPYDLWVDLAAYAADARWRREVGGVVASGVPVATDDRAKLMITGSRMAATIDPAWSTIWHGADGNTYPVDAAKMIEISDAVQAHVNATFAAFATVKAAIEAGTITTRAQVDAAFADAA